MKRIVIAAALIAMFANPAEARRHHRIKYSGATEAQIVEHPQGCPHSAYCGCGVALRIFGKHVRELWLARAWFRFPSASPGPGMVAVRGHHVFAILENRGDGNVLAYDPNSGGRQTRIHVRSLAGFRVVNPKGGRYAYN